MVLLNLVERLGAVGGRQYRVALITQQVLEELASRSVVFNDQDENAIARSSCLPSAVMRW
jgi:hypothetical protein